VGTYLADELGEALDLREKGRVLQVLEHFLAVAHRAGVVQRREQNPRDEVALRAVARDRGHDLVQVQVPGEGAMQRLPAGHTSPAARGTEQQPRQLHDHLPKPADKA